MPPLRPIPMRMRPDLIIQADGDRWIVKDPIALHYVQLADDELRLLRRLDGRSGLRELMAIVPAASLNDLADLLNQFRQSQLVVSTDSMRSQTRIIASKQRSLSRLISGGLSRLVVFRTRLCNPAPLLKRIAPIIAPLFTRPAALTWLTLTLLAAAIVILRFDEFLRDIPDPTSLITADRSLTVLLTFLAVKLVHEFAHACAAQRFGADCHEAGVMWFLLAPLPYSNVTDSWMLARRQRMIVTAAGVIAELGIAAICVLLWRFAAPGFFRSLLAGTAVLCSATTVFFNANPLVRFDGYFLLADAWNRPNLSRQAATAVEQTLERWLLGADRSLSLATAGSLSLLIYGLLSAAYRASLAFAVALLIVSMLDAWQLRTPGLVAATLLAGPMLLRPALSFSERLLSSLILRRDRLRPALRAASILFSITLVLFVPLPRTIVLPCVVEPAGEAIFCHQSGVFDPIGVYGQHVEPNTVIATVHDAELPLRLESAAADVRSQELRVRGLELQRDSANQATLPVARESLAAAQARHQEWMDLASRASLRSANNGVLWPPRATLPRVDVALLPELQGLPLDGRNRHCRIDAGTVVAFVSPRQEFSVVFIVDDHVVNELSLGLPMELQLTGMTSHVFAGQLSAVSQNSTDTVPEELLLSSLWAPATSQPAHRSVRLSRASMSMTDNHPLPRMYTTGRVRIRTASRSIAGRVREFLRRAFSM